MQLGLNELAQPEALAMKRIRREGGGRQSSLSVLEGIDDALKEGHSRTDRWLTNG